jgi:opacity protein-like surface antigen
MRHFFLICLILLLSLTSGPVMAKTASVGTFAGYYHPVPNSDIPDGINYGLKAQFNLTWTFFLEPYFLYVQEVNEETQSENIIGPSNDFTVSSLGANLIIGTSLDNSIRPYALMGIGIFDVTSNCLENKSHRFGSNWGMGMEINLIRHQLFFDINAILQFINCESNTALIGTNLNSGLNWYFNIEK